jgi:hypothetical protein
VADLQNLADILATVREPARDPGVVDASVLGAAREHDVEALLFRALRAARSWTLQPPAIQHALAEAAARAALVEQVRCAHTRSVIDALDRAGAPPLVFKGAALAYRHYPEPWLRPRIDTDLLIREEQLPRAERQFERLGLSRALKPRGTRVTHQQTYQAAVGGLVQRYDVHWKTSDPAAFADTFTYDELATHAEPLPQLGMARAIGDVHALLIACAHRVAHHFDAESLLWLYDIDLLARSLSTDAWQRLAAMAIAKRLGRVCARGLELAALRFRTPVPYAVMRDLSAVVDEEPSAAYLRPGFRRVDVLTSDLQALGWRGRVALLREHLFPAPSYILRTYGRENGLLLPALYLHRIVRGAAAWFRPLR